MKKIGIIIICTGVYNIFWDGFYESVNDNFCVESIKNFYLFTDSVDLMASKHPTNVHVQMIEDQGWVLNVMRRSELFLSIADQLTKNDFVFNLNSNYLAISPIRELEILPTADDEWLCSLCFDLYLEADPDTFTYDRNPKSGAYIPFGTGEYYFQGGFYGGRTTEFLKMSRCIKELTDEDISKKIVPIFHDESYLNRYLVDRHPRIIGTSYAKVEHWNYNGVVKGILLDKEIFFNENVLDNLKSLKTAPALSFLTDEKLELHPIGIVNLSGRLGNQMFQYSMMLHLMRQFPNRKFYLNIESLNLTEAYELGRVFNVAGDLIADRIMLDKIEKVPNQYIRYIKEGSFSKYEVITNSIHPIWILAGYWQTEKYFSEDVNMKLKFDCSKFNETSRQLLSRIVNSDQSVGIHVRRGDYVSNILTYHIMGGICTKTYYMEAVKHFDENSFFFVFSDDIQWCTENLKLPNAVYVNHNSEGSNWQDMALMSACKHQIIANSSFSWWAAWLNEYPQKKVITPLIWYKSQSDFDVVPETWIRQKLPDYDKKYEDLTIVIPMRIDCHERKRNFYLTLDKLATVQGLKIIVLEADLNSKIRLPEGVRKVFIEDYNPIFYRTKYINILCSLVETTYFGVWDTDIIVPSDQVCKAFDLLIQGKVDMVYPYDGHVYNLSDDTLMAFVEDGQEQTLFKDAKVPFLMFGGYSCGGAFMVNRKAYIDAGGENEKIMGWGPEDLERYKRWEIGGYRVARVEGSIFHMPHPKGENSGYFNDEMMYSSMGVLLETCRKGSLENECTLR